MFLSLTKRDARSEPQKHAFLRSIGNSPSHRHLTPGSLLFIFFVGHPTRILYGKEGKKSIDFLKNNTAKRSLAVLTDGVALGIIGSEEYEQGDKNERAAPIAVLGEKKEGGEEKKPKLLRAEGERLGARLALPPFAASKKRQRVKQR